MAELSAERRAKMREDVIQYVQLGSHTAVMRTSDAIALLDMADRADKIPALVAGIEAGDRYKARLRTALQRATDELWMHAPKRSRQLAAELREEFCLGGGRLKEEADANTGT